MFKNIVVTAFRIAFKQKLISLLNIVGIALGIAVSLVLIVHIRYETSFDKHIPDVDRVYRVINAVKERTPGHRQPHPHQFLRRLQTFSRKSIMPPGSGP
jgi:hypothetical protein